jgi:hypothetical protein
LTIVAIDELGAMAANNLAARVDMLEAVLKRRPAGGKP